MWWVTVHCLFVRTRFGGRTETLPPVLLPSPRATKTRLPRQGVGPLADSESEWGNTPPMSNIHLHTPKTTIIVSPISLCGLDFQRVYQ